MSEDLSISDDVMEQMCAAAFRSLCDHLRQRSDEVQNIDLMSIGGFCRNCLAKVCLLYQINVLFGLTLISSDNTYSYHVVRSHQVDGIRST